MDWPAVESAGRTVLDWGIKMGLGGIALWLIQRWFGKRDKATDRGRQLVDDARPHLAPTGGSGSQYSIALQVENRGKDTARTRRIAVAGIGEIETKDEVPVGQSRLTTALNLPTDSAFFTDAHPGRSELTLTYVDRYDNEYRLVVPVTRQNRADGGFNPQFRWQDYKTTEPRPSKKRLREIGGG